MARPKAGYKTKDGKKVPGVTTIIGRFKDSGGLLWWAFEQGKSAERGEINSLYDKRDEAADAGTLAHEMVEAYIKELPEPDMAKHYEKVVSLARQGFENYLRWAENNRIKIVQQETPLVSELYQFGGTLDAIGIDSQGKLCLLDWKTSSGIFLDFLLQLAAYMILWDENNPKKKLDGGYHMLRFSKNNADFHHHYWNELELAKGQFLLLREAYETDKLLKKRL